MVHCWYSDLVRVWQAAIFLKILTVLSITYFSWETFVDKFCQFGCYGLRSIFFGIIVLTYVAFRKSWSRGPRPCFKWYYDENHIFPIYAMLKHEQEVCMRKKCWLLCSNISFHSSDIQVKICKLAKWFYTHPFSCITLFPLDLFYYRFTPLNTQFHKGIFPSSTCRNLRIQVISSLISMIWTSKVSMLFLDNAFTLNNISLVLCSFTTEREKSREIMITRLSC